MITPENRHPDHDLLAKYLAGETTMSESETVESWLAESEENMAEFDRLSAIWNGTSETTPPFNSAAAWKKVEPKDESETPVVQLGTAKSSSRYWIAAAAMLAGVIILFGAYRSIMTGNDVEMLVAETQDEPLELLLSDGSVVYLNANSKLEYPEKFLEDGRNVTLSGEAFFEVERDTTTQFQIKADGSLVTVLGTSFNVKTGKELVEVTVETGRVALESAKKPDQRIELIAGEKGVYQKAQQQVAPSISMDADHLFWKNRKLNFNETSLAEVVADLNENYGTELSLSSPEMNGCKVSATFEDQDVDEVLEVLISTFDLKLDTIENRLVLSGSGCDNR